MAAESKSTVVKVKPSSQEGPSRNKIDSSVAKKKIVDGSSKRPLDSKPKFSTTVTKFEVKSRTSTTSSSKASSSKVTTKTSTVRTREKKVYSLPGQKFDVPEEREPLRIFYESLSTQIPSSEMAEFWWPYDKDTTFFFGYFKKTKNGMMEHGLLSPERAKKAYTKKQTKQKQLRMGTPVKSPPPLPPSKPESSKKQQQVSRNGEVKAKKRIINESDDDDDDFILNPKRRKG